VMKFLTGSERSLRDLALQLTYSLIPIALVYHISHYFALLFTDAPRLLPLISDPFAFGWDLFGTAKLLQQPITVPARIVWHAQVGSIVFGHLVSVYLAHAQALRLFPGRRKALLSQFPMLVLMVAFTTAGLWILSLPIGAGQVQDPLPTTSASPSVPVAGSMPAVLPTGPA
jgi:hypothetical protein